MGALLKANKEEKGTDEKRGRKKGRCGGADGICCKEGSSASLCGGGSRET